ncbi:MAG: putative transcriptional regulator of N-Acetylglucosamine utilization, GntR family [Candidatus Carbobacillus altaicus]|uniref:Putative transcriptional regulator of N-Acetylglucosamine utilization, GntR family n=1 Tax=Candidatus Carbonibacillus altaicus TaxID=2163959 RepID=A0A2R6Y1T5_9BACL|nr:MAG: putative transcriptional regulator of N-Acetylglucosamine utilization, GntR family [Candidatus Carbobacillus altaicus]
MLNKDTPIPLYYQLKEKLTEAIMNGSWPVGTMIPSERELSEKYGISRMTVRQALGEMVKEGLLVRKKGKGSFVAEPKINQELIRLTSFSEDMRSRGLTPDSRVKSVYLQEASPAIQNYLSLKADAQVIVVERIRLANEQPMAFETSHLPIARFPDLKHHVLDAKSLYNLLEEHYHVTIKYARQTLEASLSDAVVSKILEIPHASPVLLITRVTYDSENRPFEYVKSIYRGDRYKFIVELER